MFGPLMMIVAIDGLIAGGIFFGSCRERSEYSAMARYRSDLNKIPIGTAKQRSEILLRDVSLFSCVLAADNDSDTAGLPAGVAALLRRYDRIEALVGSRVVIDRNMARPDGEEAHYKGIGEGSHDNATGKFQLCVERTGERVVEVYPDEAVDQIFGTYSKSYRGIIFTVQEAGLGHDTGYK